MHGLHGVALDVMLTEAKMRVGPSVTSRLAVHLAPLCPFGSRTFRQKQLATQLCVVFPKEDAC